MKRRKDKKKKRERERNVKSSRRISRYRKYIYILSLDGNCKLCVFRKDFELVFVGYKSQQ